MAEVLLRIITDYKIGWRIAYFMAGNVSSNDTCIHAVLQALYPNISETADTMSSSVPLYTQYFYR